MSRFRILEKKGTYEPITTKPISCIENCPRHPPSKISGNRLLACDHQEDTGLKEYIPRYIVQAAIYGTKGEHKSWSHLREKDGIVLDWEDLKEFTDLEKARLYKLELELEEGRVIE